MATIIPASTNTTIATCVQIQNGDMRTTGYSRTLAARRRRGKGHVTIV
jgi:hypothetical protein